MEPQQPTPAPIEQVGKSAGPEARKEVREGASREGTSKDAFPQQPTQQQGAESAAKSPDGDVPAVVAEEEALLRVVLAKIDKAAPKVRTKVDDAGALIELRDALAEAKPEDHASLLEQMHRIESLSKQRGKGDQAPVDRKTPYFGHLRLEENGRRRDVLIGKRGFVEPGGGVQIVDWRNAPVSRLFYRYDEGDAYEEQLGNRLVEGEVLARRTVTILEAQLRRVTSSQVTFARDAKTGHWNEIETHTARLRVERDGTATLRESVGKPRRFGAPGAPPADKPPVDRAPTDKAGAAGRMVAAASASGGTQRTERFLPAIAALIDPRQFELISRSSSGLIVVQGSAGSGKTTIGLHRIAYLAFADPQKFRPERMLVVVYQRALANYVSRVLPSLEVPGVPVMTFSAWSEGTRQQVLPQLVAPIGDATPPLVMRAKSHAAMLRILIERQEQLADWCRDQIGDTLRARESLQQAALAAWDETRGPVDLRVTGFARWLKGASFSDTDRGQCEGVGKILRKRTRDVVGEWAALLTDRQQLQYGFAKHAPGLFSESQIDSVHAWCTERERLRLSTDAHSGLEEEDETYALDAEDDALLLRIFQLQRGPLIAPAVGGGNGASQGQGRHIDYEHLMVDEVQDFAPIELAVLLDTVTPQRSITLAGDTAQSIAPEHGFSRWSDMLDELGIPHDKVEPLRVSYRSTRQIVERAEHVLGHLGGDVRPIAPRSGAPVEAFPFGAAGEACEFLATALKELVREDAAASVAVIARHPEQARVYFEALQQSEVPRLRLVAAQDFSFTPGIDVTDVRQTKGLEFDVVILLEVTDDSYPENDHARRLLHVAMTRGAHQLWVTYTGRPSPLLPPDLR